MFTCTAPWHQVHSHGCAVPPAIHLQASPLSSLSVSTPPTFPCHLLCFCPYKLASTSPHGPLLSAAVPFWGIKPAPRPVHTAQAPEQPRSDGLRGLLPEPGWTSLPRRLRICPLSRLPGLPLGQPCIHPLLPPGFSVSGDALEPGLQPGTSLGS